MNIFKHRIYLTITPLEWYFPYWDAAYIGKKGEEKISYFNFKILCFSFGFIKNTWNK